MVRHVSVLLCALWTLGTKGEKRTLVVQLFIYGNFHEPEARDQENYQD